MSEKKLTDEEIVKALEICGTTNTCVDCPFIENHFLCSSIMAKNALDLINRHRAKIEALQMDNQQLQSDIVNANMNADHALAEIERLQGWQDLLKAEKHSLIKAEAVREFAEKIKMAFYYEFDELIPSIMADKIDHLVKEMVGEG